jgi:hypothetical protein
LLIPREATHCILSDASYAGIGGWSPDFQLQWRVTRANLILLGFPMKSIDKYAEGPMDAISEGLHINPLKFLAAIVNLWLAVKLVKLFQQLATRYIVALLYDTSTSVIMSL